MTPDSCYRRIFPDNHYGNYWLSAAAGAAAAAATAHKTDLPTQLPVSI